MQTGRRNAPPLNRHVPTQFTLFLNTRFRIHHPWKMAHNAPREDSAFSDAVNRDLRDRLAPFIGYQ